MKINGNYVNTTSFLEHTIKTCVPCQDEIVHYEIEITMKTKESILSLFDFKIKNNISLNGVIYKDVEILNISIVDIDIYQDSFKTTIKFNVLEKNIFNRKEKEKKTESLNKQIENLCKTQKDYEIIVDLCNDKYDLENVYILVSYGMDIKDIQSIITEINKFRDYSMTLDIKKGLTPRPELMSMNLMKKCL